jgi:hypothetical protein
VKGKNYPAFTIAVVTAALDAVVTAGAAYTVQLVAAAALIPSGMMLSRKSHGIYRSPFIR